MVINNLKLKFFLLLILLVLTGYSHARSVKSVDISSIGQTLKEVTNPYEINACKKFRPTKKQVINYFNHAYPVELNVIIKSRYSSCYAEGDLSFSDGSFGTWRLYSSGGSTFIFNSGDTVTLLYKHNQWHDPNAGTYDIK